MAKNGINFLHQYQRKVTKQYKIDKKLLQGAGAGVAVVVVLVLTAIAGTFFLQYQVKQVQAEAKDLEKTILANEETEKSVVLLGKKLTVLSTLFEERHDKQEALRYFTSLFGDQVVVKDIDYEAKDSILSLRVAATSVFEVERIFTLIQTDETRQKYPTISSSELRRGNKGGYEVTITVALGEPEVIKKSPTPPVKVAK
jgi:hypothetical protein